MILTAEKYAFLSKVAASLGNYMELEKRLQFCPFPHRGFTWFLIFEPTPHFFVIRDLLRRLGLPFTVTANPRSRASVNDDALVLTPWSMYDDGGDVLIRGELHPNSRLPLYVEAGSWDIPQCNPLFDWTEEQAWTYLIDQQLVFLEET